MTDDLEEARAAYFADIDALADLDDDQVHYLGNLDQVEDRLSDGIDCETDVETS